MFWGISPTPMVGTPDLEDQVAHMQTFDSTCNQDSVHFLHTDRIFSDHIFRDLTSCCTAFHSGKALTELFVFTVNTDRF